MVAVQTAFANSQAVFPGAHVRPVIVYIDDIDLAAPSETAAAIDIVRFWPGGRPILWTVAYQPVTAQLHPDRSADWGFAGDPALATRLAAMVKADLPLQTTASLSSGPVPLLDAAQLETTREFKVCKIPNANVTSFPSVGITHVLDRGHRAAARRLAALASAGAEPGDAARAGRRAEAGEAAGEAAPGEACAGAAQAPASFSAAARASGPPARGRARPCRLLASLRPRGRG